MSRFGPLTRHANLSRYNIAISCRYKFSSAISVKGFLHLALKRVVVSDDISQNKEKINQSRYQVNFGVVEGAEKIPVPGRYWGNDGVSEHKEMSEQSIIQVQQ
jgi:hypothetical protein